MKVKMGSNFKDRHDTQWTSWTKVQNFSQTLGVEIMNNTQISLSKSQMLAGFVAVGIKLQSRSKVIKWNHFQVLSVL